MFWLRMSRGQATTSASKDSPVPEFPEERPLGISDFVQKGGRGATYPVYVHMRALCVD